MADDLPWELILGPVIKKVVNVTWDAIAGKIDIGTCVMTKDSTFARITGRLHKRASKLLDARNVELKHLYTVYGHQDGKIVVGDDIRIAYAHQCHFIPGAKDFVDFASLRATKGKQYNVNGFLGIPGFEGAGQKYRLALEQQKKKRDRRSLPFKGTTVRVNDWNGQDEFVLGFSYYTDQYVTNQKEIIDTPFSEIAEHGYIDMQQKRASQTLRRENTEDGKLLPFSKSSLANTIGIAATLVTSDGYLILPKRNRQVHFQSGYEGCSISGSLVFQDSLFTNLGLELAHQLVTKEGPQELILDPAKSQVEPLAFAREFERGGHPQFFFHVWSNETLSDFQEKWSKSEYAKKEYDSIRWIQLFEPTRLRTPDGAADVAAEHLWVLVASNALITLDDKHDVVLSEEARANLFYLMVFLQTLRGEAFPKAWR